jgi:hypothetical protein
MNQDQKAKSPNCTAEVLSVAINSIRPTPANWELYRRPEADSEIPKLAESIRQNGILQPLVVSQDRFILSGHRRHAAAKLAGLTHVPVIREPVTLADLTEAERVQLLASHNAGARIKTAAESVAEAMLAIDPEEAIREAKERKAQVFAKAQSSPARVEVTTIGNRRTDPRAKRGEFLAAVLAILEDLKERKLTPTSERHIHYKLLPIGPKTSKGVKGNVYGTDPHGDPDKLSKLLTDARSAGLIPHNWIADETRGEYVIYDSGTVGDYVAYETEDLFGNYVYNVHEDQPNHLELLVEKNTMYQLMSRHVAHPLRIPLTSGRGYSSFPVSCKIVDRFRDSGKDRLVLITVCDHDPDGFNMPEALKKYIQIDHGIEAEVIRAAITTKQIREFNLPPCIEAKESSSRFKNYVKHTGMTDAWELDSLDPATLIKLVSDTCRSHMDIGAFNAALERENEAEVKLARLRAALAKQVPALFAEIEAMEGAA